MILENMGPPVYQRNPAARDIGLPSGGATDDKVILIIAAFDSNNAATVNLPAGWTAIKKDLIVSNIRVSILMADFGT